MLIKYVCLFLIIVILGYFVYRNNKNVEKYQDFKEEWKPLEKSKILLPFLRFILKQCIGSSLILKDSKTKGGDYYEKYMKYKTKYLQLKELMDII